MFCSNCGSQLKDEAKFCGNCGTKIENRNNVPVSDQFVENIDIAPIPLSYKKSDIEITDVFAKGPDDDGDLRVTVKYSVTNNTDIDWEFYETRCQLFSANGLIVDETRDTSEMTISTGCTEDLEASFWSIKAHALGAYPEKAHAVVTFTASEFAQQKLGEVKIPENPFEVAPIKPAKIDNLLSLVTCSLWKTEPDSDKDCRVEIKAFIQNHTLLHLPEVKMLAKITDAKGREVTDASGYEEMRPATIAVISGSGYTKEKKLVGANAELTLRAYWPVAVGVDQRQGMIISEIETEERENYDQQDDNDEYSINGNSFRSTNTS